MRAKKLTALVLTLALAASLGLPALGWLLLWYLSYGESQLGENKYGDPPWN